jgi:hypothetical protein
MLVCPFLPPLYSAAPYPGLLPVGRAFSFPSLGVRCGRVADPVSLPRIFITTESTKGLGFSLPGPLSC